MINTSFTTDVDDLKRKLAALDSRSNQIMSRAANRAMTTAAKTVRQEVAKKYFVKSTRVGSTIHTTKASASKPTAKIVSRDVHENLAKFKVTPNRQVRITKAGKYSPSAYKAGVKRTGGKKPLASDPKPFIATMSNGYTGLFRRKAKTQNKGLFRGRFNKRKSNGRSSIEGVAGPAIPQMIKDRDILDTVNDKASEMLLGRLQHEIDRALKN